MTSLQPAERQSSACSGDSRSQTSSSDMARVDASARTSRQNSGAVMSKRSKANMISCGWSLRAISIPFVPVSAVTIEASRRRRIDS